jgi:hypothetical protein
VRSYISILHSEFCFFHTLWNILRSMHVSSLLLNPFFKFNCSNLLRIEYLHYFIAFAICRFWTNHSTEQGV